MYDYEWVDPTLFNHGCARILLPDAITPQRCREAGIAARKVVFYPGFKENLYLGTRPLDGSVAADLGLREDAVRVLLRPPATTAHYHNPAAERILTAILARLAGRADVQLVLLPRTPDQVELVRAAGIADVIVPRRVYDGPSLIAAMDLVLSGGGTMTREAAILGVPSTSFFRGRTGMVDEALARQGRLTLLATPEDVQERLRLVKRQGPVVPPDPGPLVAFVVDAILGAVRSRGRATVVRSPGSPSAHG
jgi:predicted glycosyltransferase